MALGRTTPRRALCYFCAFLVVLVGCILLGISVAIVPWNHCAVVQDEIYPGIPRTSPPTTHSPRPGLDRTRARRGG